MASHRSSPMVQYEDEVVFAGQASSVPSTTIAAGSPVVSLGFGSETINVECLVNNDGEFSMD